MLDYEISRDHLKEKARVASANKRKTYLFGSTYTRQGERMSYFVKHYMSRDVPTVDSNASAYDASVLMAEKKTGFLIVVQASKPVGIVTEHDLVMKVMANRKDAAVEEVSEFMSSPLVVIGPNATVEEAANIMHEHRIRRLPVVDADAIHGVFTSRSLAEHYSYFQEKIIKDMTSAQTLYGVSLNTDFL